MKNEKNTVDGYLFEDEESFQEAVNESRGVEYLRGRTDFSNPQSVLRIYLTVIEKKLFKTPIGYEFLRELQNILYQSQSVEEEKIPPIPVYVKKKKREKLKFRLPKVKKIMDHTSPYYARFVHMLIVNVILVIFLILFIFISNNSKNLNVINYKNRIDAEYQEKEDNLAKWEEALSQREKALEK